MEQTFISGTPPEIEWENSISRQPPEIDGGKHQFQESPLKLSGKSVQERLLKLSGQKGKFQERLLKLSGQKEI